MAQPQLDHPPNNRRRWRRIELAVMLALILAPIARLFYIPKLPPNDDLITMFEQSINTELQPGPLIQWDGGNTVAVATRDANMAIVCGRVRHGIMAGNVFQLTFYRSTFETAIAPTMTPRAHSALLPVCPPSILD